MRRGQEISGAAASSQDEEAQILDAFRSRRLHRRSTRDRIPAYLILGPPGMGKSAVVEHAGIHVERSLELPSSTWWIGEEAVLVEISLPRAEPVEHPVLPLLRTLRPAIPVSGVVLVASPADLTLADASEQSDLSAALVGFLRAFEFRFRYAPPLYIVVSKLDLTPGFAEFFDRLQPGEREQPWGFTLPVELGFRRAVDPTTPPNGRAQTLGVPSQRYAASLPARHGLDGSIPAEPEGLKMAYQAGFRRMLDAIRTRVTQWVSPETDPLQSARIAGFGAQVAALDAILKPIVDPLLPADDRRWRGIWLRGVYLTSTQQDALSIDVLLPEMVKRFGLPRTGTPPPDLGRDEEALGYFVAGVFRRVILPEAGLAQQRYPGRRSSAARNWALVAAAVAACAALGFVFAFEYQEGVTRIQIAGDAVETLAPALSTIDPSQVSAVLPALDALAASGADPSNLDPRMAFSLDRYADALIGRATQRIYDRALVVSLVPHLAQRLDRDLVKLDAPSEALRTALAAASADRTGDADAYRRWLSDTAASLSPDARADFERHSLETLRTGAVPMGDSAYMGAARGILESRGEASP